jgi:sulfate adenylyltransferase
MTIDSDSKIKFLPPGRTFGSELKMDVVTYENMVYIDEKTGYLPESQVQEGMKTQKLSGTEFRRRLRTGEDIPEWFSFNSVIGILRNAGDRAFCAA